MILSLAPVPHTNILDIKTYIQITSGLESSTQETELIFHTLDYSIDLRKWLLIGNTKKRTFKNSTHLRFAIGIEHCCILGLNGKSISHLHLIYQPRAVSINWEHQKRVDRLGELLEDLDELLEE